jgi:site-specific recombinase XerD
VSLQTTASTSHSPAVVTLGHAVDFYIAHLAREGRSNATRASYRRLLTDFARSCREKAPAELELADYERFLDRWTDSSPSTLASGVSLVKGFSRFLFERGYAPVDVAAPLKRPRRKRPEDLDVVTVSAEDVLAMLCACADLQEFICMTTCVYIGARRAALARIRRRDVDLVNGTVRLLEKGGKVAVKPLPGEYQAILIAAERDGLWTSPNDYLIPNRRPASVRRIERSDKIVWETVKRVAARAGVRAHVHALRSAFAVAFDEAHPDQVIALKELMGHTRIETTLVYLRRKDRAKAMEQVRDLSWGLTAQQSNLPKPASGFESQPREAHTGFEPVPPP